MSARLRPCRFLHERLAISFNYTQSGSMWVRLPKNKAHEIHEPGGDSHP